MKKNIKKILGVFLSVLLVIVPIISTNVEKVEAETSANNCYEHTNYYFFLYVAGYDYFTTNNKFSNGQFVVRHSSDFSTEVPVGTVADGAQIEWITMGKNSGDDGWTYKKYWEAVETLGKLQENAEIKKISDSVWYYKHKIWWEDPSGQMQNGLTPSDIYSQEDNIASTFFAQTTKGSRELNLKSSTIGDTVATIDVVRTIKESDWTPFRAEQLERKTQSSDGKHPTEGRIWFPGLLQAKFQVCDELPEEPEEPEEPIVPEEKYKLTINYQEADTKIELKNPKVAGTYPAGESYNVTCDSSIVTSDGTYTLTSNKNLSGTMPAANKDEYCYYKLNETPVQPEDPVEPTYKVTVNYLDKKTKDPIRDPYTHPNTYKNGEKYQAVCPDSFNGGTYIFDSNTGNLNGKIAGTDIVIDCLYITESAPTSDIPIYIVWGVGGAALAYSIYYFRKYYKQENNA